MWRRCIGAQTASKNWISRDLICSRVRFSRIGFATSARITARLSRKGASKWGVGGPHYAQYRYTVLGEAQPMEPAPSVESRTALLENKVAIMVVVDQRGNIHRKYPWDLIEKPGGWAHPCGCLIWRALEGRPPCKHLYQNMRAAVTPAASGTGGGEGCRTDRKQAEGDLRTPEANHHALTFLNVSGHGRPIFSPEDGVGLRAADRKDVVASWKHSLRRHRRHLAYLARQKQSNTGGP